MELVELVPFAALPWRGTKPLAKSPLKKFGSYAEAIHASETRLRSEKNHQMSLDCALVLRKQTKRRSTRLSPGNQVKQFPASAQLRQIGPMLAAKWGRPL